jgi:precorrin-2 dehydrogenase/sirohydrochlorin ferrochelatase
MNAQPTSAALPRMFPVFLKLEKRPALTVGAGSVATEKIESLLAAGARVTVIAPEATDRVRGLAEDGVVMWKAREFREADVEGFRIVVASTSDPLVNRAVYWAASHRGIPVNVVDVPGLCDFYFGSVVRRGPVTVAISTAGASPALARRLREFLECVLPRRLDRLARSLAGTRPRLLRSIPGFRDRNREVDRLLDELPFPELDGKSEQEIGDRVGRWIQEVSR